jgi:2-hydroxy-4-carboxymuconate semialdehyde hemiacetal dehydrogenase
MKICVAGQGAFGQKHLDALKRIPEVEVTSLVGGNQDATAEVAKKYKVPHHTGDLSEGIKRADAVILTTPTKLHFRQGEQVMRAGKHVLIEIPVADSVEDAEGLVRIAKETGVVAMGGHVRRFNPSHQWVHKRIVRGELKVQQMDVQTYFFRRRNINAAATSMPPATRAAGPIISSGITPRTRSIFSSIRRARPYRTATRCRGRSIRNSVSPWTWALSPRCRTGPS